jgi:hypothetical protein
MNIIVEEDGVVRQLSARVGLLDSEVEACIEETSWRAWAIHGLPQESARVLGYGLRWRRLGRPADPSTVSMVEELALRALAPSLRERIAEEVDLAMRVSCSLIKPLTFGPGHPAHDLVVLGMRLQTTLMALHDYEGDVSAVPNRANGTNRSARAVRDGEHTTDGVT